MSSLLWSGSLEGSRSIHKDTWVCTALHKVRKLCREQGIAPKKPVQLMVLHELQFLPCSFGWVHQLREGVGYISLSSSCWSAAIGKASAWFLVRITQHKLRETVTLQPWCSNMMFKTGKLIQPELNCFILPLVFNQISSLTTFIMGPQGCLCCYNSRERNGRNVGWMDLPLEINAGFACPDSG